MRLSLSKAWDESRMVLVRERRLLVSVALALVVLPQTVVGLLTPGAGGEQSGLTFALLAITVIVGFVAQVALNRLAIGPSTTVGAAIGRGFARMPALIGSFIMVLVGLFIVLIPLVLLFGALGLIVEPTATQAAPPSLLLLIVFLAGLTYAVFQLTIPVAAAEHGGSIHLLTRSWHLARGSYLRLLAFVVLVFICLVIVVIAGQFAIGSMIAVTLGPPDVLSLSALLISLVVALLQSVVTVIFAVMLARIYVQLAGRAEADPSAPKSGT